MKPKKQVKKKAVRAERRKYDPAWKEVIEKLFEQFLDTGMRPINPFSDMGDQAADVLVKVQLTKP